MDLTKAVTQRIVRYRSVPSTHGVSSRLARRVSWSRALCKVVVTSLLHTVCYVMCSEHTQYQDRTEESRQCVFDMYTHITDCVQDNTQSVQHNTLVTFHNKRKWTSIFAQIANTNNTDPLFILQFLQSLHLFHYFRREHRNDGDLYCESDADDAGLYFTQRNTNNPLILSQTDDHMLLVMFTVLPLFPQLQSVALRFMQREERWDVLSQACLSHVWEHDRRRLFTAAVDQRQWDVVMQWSDHTLHDDQRYWAMNQAYNQKQWGSYLQLADHGLTLDEQMHAHYMLAKHADWPTVEWMAWRGVDVTEVRVLLQSFAFNFLRKQPRERDVAMWKTKWENIVQLETYLTDHAMQNVEVALEDGQWDIVLYHILHQPSPDFHALVVRTLIQRRAWPVLMHLVRMNSDAAQRDWLFPHMVRLQAWGVCRMLLEYRVHVHLCLEALPELMDRNQWTLVGMVMEHYQVDDAVRRRVMQLAFDKREGVLYWQCLTTMKNKQDLSVETREKLFHQSISRDIWQAVKALLNRKDSTGIRLRDIAFLEAIEQHLWDVVDHCDFELGADINMEDENGETPINREARKGEWKAVKEIAHRHGTANHLDKDGVGVLNRLIHNKQWKIVKYVIRCGGNIHLPARYHQDRKHVHSPLQALIHERRMDIIEYSIIWCPDQGKGVTDEGETCLHAACDTGKWDFMRQLVARKANPLVVTRTGLSALVYAVLNKQCPQKMLAQCIWMGFHTHQPSMTRFHGSLLTAIVHDVFRDIHICDAVISSPLLCAILRDLPVVARMLYESGSCSYRELFLLYTELPKLTDTGTQEGRELSEEVQRLMWPRPGPGDLAKRYSRLTKTIEKYADFVREVATSPRTLKSSCRLVISHCLDIHDKNHDKFVDYLPLTDEMKKFVGFSDLCDPDYGKGMVLPTDDPQGDRLASDAHARVFSPDKTHHKWEHWGEFEAKLQENRDDYQYFRWCTQFKRYQHTWHSD